MSGRDGGTGRRAVCAGCGCLCDDLRLEDPPYRAGEGHVDTDCALGRAWFATRVFGRAPDAAPPEVDGETVDLPTAAARAAELLRAARRPLVTGLDRLSLEGQRGMVEVADRIGADLDPVPGEGAGTRLAIHREGGPFLTLGEIRERVDCLVLWFVEPDRTHPRLLERFYPDDTAGGGERTLVAVGPAAEETGADLAVPVDRSDGLRLLWLLRLLAADPGAPERQDDPLGSAAAELMERIRDASSGAWLHDGEAGRRTGPVEVSGILRLLTTLNEDVPWGARPLRGEGNPAGAEAVATWQAGYPGPLTFRGGAPRYDGGASSDERSECDAVLLAGGHPGDLPFPDRPPCVWLDTGQAADDADGDGKDPDGPGAADAGATERAGRTAERGVRIPVLPAAAGEGDTLIRMDGVGVRSPGVPGAGDWPGVHAAEALRAVLRELAGAERGEAAP